MKNDENWENEIDWSKRTTVVGGTAFYEFVKDKAIPVLDDGIAEALKVIIEVGARLHGICRRAKKSIKRSGSAFWARLDGWNALRLAV